MLGHTLVLSAELKRELKDQPVHKEFDSASELLPSLQLSSLTPITNLLVIIVYIFSSQVLVMTLKGEKCANTVMI